MKKTMSKVLSLILAAAICLAFSAVAASAQTPDIVRHAGRLESSRDTMPEQDDIGDERAAAPPPATPAPQPAPQTEQETARDRDEQPADQPAASVSPQPSQPPRVVMPSVQTPSAEAANKLNALGLFNGVGANADGTPNFDLGRPPTRHEAVTMLVRLLGKDTEAQSGTWTTPFTDVDDWAKPYVGYAYTNGLTTGTSETTFSGGDTITASQYITFVLRALGYSSSDDFAWDRAWVLSDNIGFTKGQFNAATTEFLRGDVASISYDALHAGMKESGLPLYSTLISAGVFSEAGAKNAGLIPTVVPDWVTLSQTTAAVDVGKTLTLTATVAPDDAEDKSVTWSSSNERTATVSRSGVVTGVAAGSATITATTSNGKTATCSVTVSVAPPYVVPVLNHEYGPFTVTSYYSSGRPMRSVAVSSLVFTKIEQAATPTMYRVYISMQGVSDESTFHIKVRFYDANDRVLSEEALLESVAPNQPFNILVNKLWENEAIKNAVRMEFYSTDGYIATPGLNSGSQPGGDPGGTPGGDPGSTPGGDPGGTPGGDPGGYNDNDYGPDGKLKFSYSDAVTLLEYANGAMKSANQALEYTTNALKTSGVQSTIALEQAKIACKGAKSSLSSALTLLNNRTDLKLTGQYATGAILVQAGIDALDAVINEEVASDSATLLRFSSLMTSAAVLCAGFGKVMVEFVGAF